MNQTYGFEQYRIYLKKGWHDHACFILELKKHFNQKDMQDMVQCVNKSVCAIRKFLNFEKIKVLSEGCNVFGFMQQIDTFLFKFKLFYKIKNDRHRLVQNSISFHGTKHMFSNLKPKFT